MMDKKMLKAMMMDKEDKDPMMKKKLMAKMEVLKELMQMADDSETAGLMDGMQEVTVAAPDKEGLEEGLEKAQEITEDMPEEIAMDDSEMMDEDDEDEVM